MTTFQPTWAMASECLMKKPDAYLSRELGEADVPFIIASAFCMCERVASALHEHGQANDDETALALELECAAMAATLMVSMSYLGNTNWHFRHRMHLTPGRYAPPDVLTQPMRTHLRSALKAWNACSLKDVLVAFELVLVCIDDLVYKTTGENLRYCIIGMHADVMDEFKGAAQ